MPKSMPGAVSTAPSFDRAPSRASSCIDVVELEGESARQALVETLSAGLELVPLDSDAWSENLQRAGFTFDRSTERNRFRAEVTP